MNLFNKMAISLLTVIVITTSSMVQAEGLLGGLFGSNESKGFKQMLSYVPADTSYLLANKKPMPEEVVEFQLQRAQQMIEMFTKSFDMKKVSSDTNEKNENASTSTTTSKSKPTEKNKSAKFVEALLTDLNSKLSSKKLNETGLSTTGNNVIYGLQTIPVLRFGISDKDAILATLKRAEKTSGYKLELMSCGDFDCFVNQDQQSEMTVAAVLLKDHIALSVFPQDKKETMIQHLIGKALPEKPYSEKDWDTFLADNSFSGYGDGYINLQRLYENIKPLIIAEIKQDAGNKYDEKSVEACFNVANEHVDNMPELLFGTKDLQKTSMHYEFVVKTSPMVSNVLQTIANKTNINKRSENAIMDLGLNINFIKLRDAITRYTTFLASSAEKNKCKEIDPMEIRKAMGGMMIAMNMGLTQFKSLYFAINDIEFGDKMQPERVDAYVSIGTEDPAGLVGMLAVINPAFATLQLPADGKTVKLPAGLIPAKDAPVPPISLSRGEKILNVMVGNDKPVLVTYKSKKPEILSFNMDGKRYYEKMTKLMESMPQKATTKTGKEQEEALAIFKSIGGMSGQIKEKIYADDRGLVIDYHIQY